jgi:hypothetical protein
MGQDVDVLVSPRRDADSAHRFYPASPDDVEGDTE